MNRSITALAGIFTRSQGYRLDDNAFMTSLVLSDCLARCAWEGVEPIGELQIHRSTTWDGSDEAVRWELVLT